RASCTGFGGSPAVLPVRAVRGVSTAIVRAPEAPVAPGLASGSGGQGQRGEPDLTGIIAGSEVDDPLHGPAVIARRVLEDLPDVPGPRRHPVAGLGHPEQLGAARRGAGPDRVVLVPVRVDLRVPVRVLRDV